MFGSKQEKIAKAVKKKKAAKLIGFLKDKDSEVYLAAIEGLGDVGGDEAFNALVPLLHNGDAQFRIASANAMGRMGNAHAQAFIAHQASVETDEKVREVMNKAMGMLKQEQ